MPGLGAKILKVSPNLAHPAFECSFRQHLLIAAPMARLAA